MIGDRNGKGERVLAEWITAKGLFWEQPKSPHNSHRSEVGPTKGIVVTSLENTSRPMNSTITQWIPERWEHWLCVQRGTPKEVFTS